MVGVHATITRQRIATPVPRPRRIPPILGPDLNKPDLQTPAMLPANRMFLTEFLDLIGKTWLWTKRRMKKNNDGTRCLTIDIVPTLKFTVYPVRWGKKVYLVLDAEEARKAKEAMEKNVKNTLTLPEVAERLGINYYTLRTHSVKKNGQRTLEVPMADDSTTAIKLRIVTKGRASRSLVADTADVEQLRALIEEKKNGVAGILELAEKLEISHRHLLNFMVRRRDELFIELPTHEGIKSFKVTEKGENDKYVTTDDMVRIVEAFERDGETGLVDLIRGFNPDGYYFISEARKLACLTRRKVVQRIEAGAFKVREFDQTIRILGKSLEKYVKELTGHALNAQELKGMVQLECYARMRNREIDNDDIVAIRQRLARLSDRISGIVIGQYTADLYRYIPHQDDPEYKRRNIMVIKINDGYFVRLEDADVLLFSLMLAGNKGEVRKAVRIIEGMNKVTDETVALLRQAYPDCTEAVMKRIDRIMEKRL